MVATVSVAEVLEGSTRTGATSGRFGPMKKLIALGIIAAALSAAGCSEVETTLNKGGDTSCADYLKQDAHTQRVTVTKFLKQRNGTNDDPAGTAVDLTMSAVAGLCSVQANRDTAIKNASLIGIFGPPPTN